jgi:stress response protein NST1
MKNINKKTGIFLGVATVISLTLAVAGMIKARSKYKKQDRFYEFEENDMETDNDIQFWEEEYLKEEEKSEEEKQQEFRELSVTVLDALFKEVLFISETVKNVEEEVKKQSEYKELLEELERGKDEIISLWEHLEALSNMREEHIIEKDRG